MENCPLCHNTMVCESKKIETLHMAYNYSYIVYSCEACNFVVDFTSDTDIRFASISAAFRKVASDLSKIHTGDTISEDLMNMYKAFVESKDFQSTMKIWERNKTSFWEENKHLLVYLK